MSKNCLRKWMCNITSVANGDRPVCPQARVVRSATTTQTTVSTVHFIEKFPIARTLGDQLETGGSEAHLSHSSTVTVQAITGLTFADHP